MIREKLLRSKLYGASRMKYSLLNLIGEYQRKHALKDKDLAKHLNVSAGYVSQLLHGTYDHKLSKVAELAHSCNAIPLLFFINTDDFVKNDALEKVYTLVPVQREQNIQYEEKGVFQTAPVSLKQESDILSGFTRQNLDNYAFSSH